MEKRTKKELWWAINWLKQLCNIRGSQNKGPEVTVSVKTTIWESPRVIYPHEAPGQGTMALCVGVLVGWQIFHALGLKHNPNIENWKLCLKLAQKLYDNAE